MNRLLFYVLLVVGCGVAKSGRVPEVSETGCPPSGGHRDPTGSKTFDSTQVDHDALVADDVPHAITLVRESIRSGAARSAEFAASQLKDEL